MGSLIPSSTVHSIKSNIFVFRNFKEVVGIEMNSEFCQIQLKVVEEHQFSTPIKIICDDMRNQLEILSKANFVTMNNVFGFFQNVETQVCCHA